MPKFPFPIEELEDRIQASLMRIKSHICDLCSFGVMREYLGENRIKYLKCATCGFTKEKKD